MVALSQRGQAAWSFMYNRATALRQAAQVRATNLVSRLSAARRVAAAIAGTPARTRVLADAARKKLARATALMWHRGYYARYYALRWKARYGTPAALAALLALMSLSGAASGAIQHILDPYAASSDGIATLRTAMVTLGGALVGATAIAFSIVMLAVQINFARMPHGLFRRLSSDWKLLGSFAASFFLAVGVIAASTVPDRSWAAVSLLASGWATVLVLILFLYAYRRALLLINPSEQLLLLVRTAENELRGSGSASLDSRYAAGSLFLHQPKMVSS